MDFFASQEHARKKTRWLIFYFVLAVVCMVAGVYFVVLFATGGTRIYAGQELENFNLFNPGMLAIVSLAVGTVVGSGSLYKVAELRGGGQSVAQMLGGRRLQPNSSDQGERRILNVVEEMALAAGTPVPPVYIIEEPGINAFAAGYTVDDAVIGINRGTIEQLNRDELQGVVAHEFSHILNGDMRMSIRMIAILHGIQLLALIGFYVLRGSAFRSHRSSGDSKGAGAAIILIAVGVILIGWIGLFFARIIKASVSRQREFLADASAVQFTRNPDGIAGALKMIGASQQGSVIQATQAEVASHMFFASMFKPGFVNIFATHPPLNQRIQKIDPRFDGDYRKYAESRIHARRKRMQTEKQEKQQQAGFATGRGFGMLPGIADRFPIDPLILIAGIGLPGDDDVAYSNVLVDNIPDVLLNAARDVFSARCIVLAALLDPNVDVGNRQLQTIADNLGQGTVQETLKLLDSVKNIDPRFRLPVFEILQGTLSGMSLEQYQSFRSTVDSMIQADEEVDLFEFFLRHHMIVHLDRRFGIRLPPQVKYRAVEPMKEDICLVLAILVRLGHESKSDAQAAFTAAVNSLEKPWQDSVSLLDQSYSYESLAEALNRLVQTTPAIKKRVLTAAAVAITHDHKVTVEEAELFRAMSESLDCPVPPVVASPAQVRHHIS